MTRHKPDYFIFFLAVTLTAIGLVWVYSASYPRAAARSAEQWEVVNLHQAAEESPTPSLLDNARRQGVFAIKHAGFAILGMLLLCGAVLISPDALRSTRIGWAGIIVTLVLLVLTYTGLGSSSSTFAHRWLTIGPLTIQPSEFAKITLVVFLAQQIAHSRGQLNEWRWLRVPLLTVAIIMGAVLAQPHLGGTAMLALAVAAILYVAGLSGRNWAIIGVALALCLCGTLILKPYQVERLTSFINPLEDPEGSGMHIIRAGTALSRGGLSGRGLGRSIEKFDWLPECHSDSIFAIIGEETGLLGTLTLLTLLLALGGAGMRVASGRPDAFGRLLAVGLTTGLVGQGLFNIGVTSGLFPQTGVGLPFISYGGTSLLVSLTAIGLLLNLSCYTALPETPRETGWSPNDSNGRR